jgi:hypothetical protein
VAAAHVNDQGMDTLTEPNHQDPVARINVDDESVEVFLPDAERWRVVIATMDEQRRPRIVGGWEPELRRSMN